MPRKSFSLSPRLRYLEVDTHCVCNKCHENIHVGTKAWFDSYAQYPNSNWICDQCKLR